MSSVGFERDHVVLNEELIISDYPIQVAGCALLIRNDSEADSILSLQESADGVVWIDLEFSIPAAAAQLLITIVAKSMAVILFASVEEYVRLTLAARSDVGLYIDFCQFTRKQIV